MIVTAFISWLLSWINYILSLFPNVDPSVTAQITGTVNGFRTALTNINWFFPIDTALSLLGIVFVIQGLLFLWKLFRYVGGIFTLGLLK